MIRYKIRINNGDSNQTKTYYFVHKDWEKLLSEEQDNAFDCAVKELNHIYQDYGRFATSTGVLKLFDKFGFEQTLP